MGILEEKVAFVSCGGHSLGLHPLMRPAEGANGGFAQKPQDRQAIASIAKNGPWRPSDVRTRISGSSPNTSSKLPPLG